MDEQSKFSKISLMILSLMTCIAVFLSGCAAESPGVSVSEPADTPPEPPAEAADSGEVEVQDPKPKEEVIEETLEQAIADGTYSDSITYEAPPGDEEMEIDVTIEDSVVTDVSITTLATDEVSIKYQDNMNNNLPDLVVGKRIDEIDLPAIISGSSLTGAAVKAHFDSFLETH